jgi:hypothetical protein
MNSLLGVYTIWYRDILRFWYDKARMLSAILFPIMFLFIFGSGLKGSIGIMGGGVDFVQFMYPGIMGMSVLMGSFISGVSIVWDREFGFLKEVLVAPSAVSPSLWEEPWVQLQSPPSRGLLSCFWHLFLMSLFPSGQFWPSCH